MSVKVILSPRHAKALLRAVERAKPHAMPEDERDALNHAERRLLQAMLKHRVEP